MPCAKEQMFSSRAMPVIDEKKGQPLRAESESDSDATGSRPLSQHSIAPVILLQVYLPGNCEITSDVSGTVISGEQQTFHSSWTKLPSEDEDPNFLRTLGKHPAKATLSHPSRYDSLKCRWSSGLNCFLLHYKIYRFF